MRYQTFLGQKTLDYVSFPLHDMCLSFTGAAMSYNGEKSCTASQEIQNSIKNFLGKISDSQEIT